MIQINAPGSLLATGGIGAGQLADPVATQVDDQPVMVLSHRNLDPRRHQGFRLAHQGADLLRQRHLGAEHPLIAYGLVLAGVGIDLDAIQSHVPKAQNSCLLAEPQDLKKQSFEGFEIAAPKIPVRL